LGGGFAAAQQNTTLFSLYWDRVPPDPWATVFYNATLIIILLLQCGTE